jgi:hypothetical protein
MHDPNPVFDRYFGQPETYEGEVVGGKVTVTPTAVAKPWSVWPALGHLFAAYVIASVAVMFVHGVWLWLGCIYAGAHLLKGIRTLLVRQ